MHAMKQNISKHLVKMALQLNTHKHTCAHQQRTRICELFLCILKQNTLLLYRPETYMHN